MLAKTVCLADENSKWIVPRLLFLDSYFTCEDKSNWTRQSGAKMNVIRSLLLLSCDFMTTWNCRKLLVSKKKQVSMFLDELQLSELVLSYSAKSEQAWNHRDQK